MEMSNNKLEDIKISLKNGIESLTNPMLNTILKINVKHSEILQSPRFNVIKQFMIESKQAKADRKEYIRKIQKMTKPPI